MILDSIIGLFGGGVIGIGIKAARDAYVARNRHVETLARVEAKEAHHEREVTERFALHALDSTRQKDDIMREQSAQITDLSVKVAHCEEQHRASKIELDFTKRLAEQQSAEIARLQSEVDSLTRSLDELREQFDRFVANAMGVKRISEVPGA